MTFACFDFFKSILECYKGMRLVTILLILLTWVANAESRPGERLPLFEFGVGGGIGVIPDYPASDNSRVRGLAVPYAIYRGEIVRSDREGGLRTRLFQGSSYEVNFSFSGSFPSESDNNEARNGMSDLDWLFEVGPQLKWMFWKSGDPIRFEIRFPVRAVYSSNLVKIVDRGFIFNPEARLQFRDMPYKEANFLVTLSTSLGSERINDYFYEVKPEFQRFDRPIYDAKEGFIGTTLTVGQSIPVGDFTLYVAYSLSKFGGSTNQSSPLFKSETNETYGFGLLYNFYASEETSTP